jgi:UDP-2-acetamido-3-amino-2,3-dideoxy-glucuronate N-acetyltransferase
MQKATVLKNDFFLHEKAFCESDAIGSGTRIWAYAHVMKGATVGSGCNLGEGVFVETGAFIGDGCTIKNGVSVWVKITLEDDVFVGPNAVFTNDFTPRAFIRRSEHFFRPTLVKRGASIGANATIVCGITIGEYALIGAGAVVTRDVPKFSLVVGNPGTLVGKVCYCGTKLDKKDFCKACRKTLAENTVQDAVRSAMGG